MEDFDKDLEDILNEDIGNINGNSNNSYKTKSQNNSNSIQQQAQYQQYQQQYQNNQKSQNNNDIDDLLEDILNEDIPKIQTQQKSNFQDFQQENKGKTEKCYTTLVGTQKHLENAENYIYRSKQICQKMRCLKCDMTVNRFEYKQWQTDVEYLFFRNMFSNKNQLEKKLNPDSNCAAYCCQCSWENIQEIQEANNLKNSKWVCAGH